MKDLDNENVSTENTSTENVSDKNISNEVTTSENVSDEVASTEITSNENVSSDTKQSDKNKNQIDEVVPKKKKFNFKRKKEKSKEEVNIVKELLNLIIYIGVVIIFCFFIITYVGQRTNVHGSSMEGTLHNGDSLWVDKFTYKFKDPERFDIIVFPYQGSDIFYIKRIIGLPGESVRIDTNGTIFINDEPLSESYGYEIIRPDTLGIASTDIILGSDEYFVLGDNRNNSKDSRWSDVGNIKEDEIIGKAIFRMTPIKSIGFIK